MDITRSDLADILHDHVMWLEDITTGRKINYDELNLRHAQLSGVNIERAILKHAELERANLFGANLCRSNLFGSNLKHANLRCANLEAADLRCARLLHADLRHANLVGADLSFSNCRGANMQYADLRGVVLRGTDLRGADLRGAIIDYVSWPLSPNTLSPKVDEAIIQQLLYHTLALVEYGDFTKGFKASLLTGKNLEIANKFSRVVREQVQPIIREKERNK